MCVCVCEAGGVWPGWGLNPQPASLRATLSGYLIFYATLWVCCNILLDNIKIFSLLVVCLVSCMKKDIEPSRPRECVCALERNTGKNGLCSSVSIFCWLFGLKHTPHSIQNHSHLAYEKTLGQSEGKNASPHSVRRLLCQCKPEWWRCGWWRWALKEESVLTFPVPR